MIPILQCLSFRNIIAITEELYREGTDITFYSTLLVYILKRM